MEAPYYKIPTINIGNRQEGRTQAGDIINIPAKSNLIKNKIRLVLKNKVKQKIINRDYLKKGATKKVLRIIEKLDLKKKFNKNFFDVNSKNSYIILKVFWPNTEIYESLQYATDDLSLLE